MGNSADKPSILEDYEHKSGKRLLASIRVNQRDVTQMAIDFARKEFAKHATGFLSVSLDYDEMSAKLEKYLTKQYDIGDGVIFTKTPLEFCDAIGSSESAAVIRENLQRISMVTNGKKEGVHPVGIGIENAAVGVVTHDRAMLAKARLQAFQATRKQG
jgi:hypothetical protein